MRLEDEKLCAHPTCRCAPAPGSSFCSGYCTNVDGEEESGAACSCGHSACAHPAARTGKGSTDEVVIALGGGPGSAGGRR